MRGQTIPVVGRKTGKVTSIPSFNQKANDAHPMDDKQDK